MKYINEHYSNFSEPHFHEYVNVGTNTRPLVPDTSYKKLQEEIIDNFSKDVNSRRYSTLFKQFAYSIYSYSLKLMNYFLELFRFLQKQI